MGSSDPQSAIDGLIRYLPHGMTYTFEIDGSVGELEFKGFFGGGTLLIKPSSGGGSISHGADQTGLIFINNQLDIVVQGLDISAEAGASGPAIRAKDGDFMVKLKGVGLLGANNSSRTAAVVAEAAYICGADIQGVDFDNSGDPNEYADFGEELGGGGVISDVAATCCD